MSKKHETDALNDADMSALFADSNIAPSAEIDRAILAKAHAVNSAATVPRTQETFTQKYTPLIASAAVLVLGIALAPLMMGTPEYSLDADTVNASKTSQAQTQLSSDTAADRVNSTDGSPENAPLSEVASFSAPAVARESLPKTDISRIEESDEGRDEGRDEELVSQKQSAPNSRATELSIKTLPKAMSDTSVAPASAPASASAPAPASEVTTVAEQAISPLLLEQNEARLLAEDTDRIERNKIENTASNTVQRSRTLDSNAIESATDTELATEDSQQLTAISQADRKERSQNAIAPISTFGNRSNQNIAALNKRQTKEQGKTELETKADSALAVKPKININRTEAHKRPENFRSSELLWILEIKYLHKNNQPNLAKQELTKFREKYPQSKFENLLPIELQTI